MNQVGFMIMIYLIMFIIYPKLNDTISNLNTSLVKLSTSNSTTDSIAFGKDSSNNYGYIIPGADTAISFKSGNVAIKELDYTAPVVSVTAYDIDVSSVVTNALSYEVDKSLFNEMWNLNSNYAFQNSSNGFTIKNNTVVTLTGYGMRGNWFGKLFFVSGT